MAVKSHRSIAVFLWGHRLQGVWVPHHAGPYVPDIPGPRGTESSRLENAIGRILKVEPVGTAMKDSYERYATVQAGQVYGRVLQVGGDRYHQS